MVSKIYILGKVYGYGSDGVDTDWAKKKTSLNCMSSLSVCLVPNVHCKRSQQLRTICTCVTDYTHKFDTHRRCKELLEQNGFSVSQPLVLCLRIALT